MDDVSDLKSVRKAVEALIAVIVAERRRLAERRQLSQRDATDPVLPR